MCKCKCQTESAKECNKCKCEIYKAKKASKLVENLIVKSTWLFVFLITLTAVYFVYCISNLTDVHWSISIVLAIFGLLLVVLVALPPIFLIYWGYGKYNQLLKLKNNSVDLSKVMKQND